MDIETVFLKRSGGQPMMQITVGHAHLRNFRVAALNSNGDVIKDIHSKSVDPARPFPIANSADELDQGIITWSIKIMSNDGRPDDPYSATVEITQDGKRVRNGIFPYAGSLNQGVKVIAENAFVGVEA